MSFGISHISNMPPNFSSLGTVNLTGNQTSSFFNVGEFNTLGVLVTSDGNVEWEVWGYLGGKYTTPLISRESGEILGQRITQKGFFYIDITGFDSIRMRTVSSSQPVEFIMFASKGVRPIRQPRLENSTLNIFTNIQATTIGSVINVPNFASLGFKIEDDFGGFIDIQGRAEGSNVWRPIIITRDDGLVQSRGVGINKRGFYYVDLTGLSSIRFRVQNYTSGTVNVSAVLKTSPTNVNLIRSQKLMYGAMGFDKITAGSNDNYGTWYCIRAVTNCIIGGWTRTDALEGTADGGSDSSMIGGLTLQAGETLYGAFARIHLTEGECLAYRVNAK